MSAARTMYERASLSVTATSLASLGWDITYDSTDKLKADPTSGSAGQSFTTTVTAATNVTGSATLQVSNYDEATTTGARGAEYTYAFTINELPQYAHYAQVTANVAGSGGQAYVARSAAEATGSYTTSETSASSSAQSKEVSVDVGNFYLFAFPDFGYKCTGWGVGSSAASATLAYAHNTTAITVPSSAASEASPATVSYYAHFSNAGVTVKDIYLAAGDTVRLYYYNASYTLWSARVNTTWLTAATAASATSYATYARSAANSSTRQEFNLLVTATAASGEAYDQLTVQDGDGNVCHYRIHVTDARSIYKNRTATATVNSFFSAQWLATPTDATTLTATVSPDTPTDSATVTLKALKATDTAATVKVSNYQNDATTGPQGADYTLAATITDPPVYTFYAQVATEVVGGSSAGIGAGWAYAALTRQEDSDVYQTTRSVSGVASEGIYEDNPQAEVGGLYIFAFPNLGYRFAGWSKNDPNGEIISTEAYHHATPITVTSTSRDVSNPTLDTYYAHFVKDESRVRDITLAVGDSVRLSWYNTKADTWSLQVVYTNGEEEVVVNLDDTAAHAGGYANYTRSAAVSTDSNEFSMLVEATARSGDAYDALTIEDCQGNVYHYRVRVIDRRVVEQHETLTFPVTSFASKTWSKTGVDSLNVTVSIVPLEAATNAATVHVTGVAKSTSTFNVSNYQSSSATGPLGAAYVCGMNVIEPWPVEFCQGDSVVIYYHNTEEKNWYLLINGNRVEPNVAGKGTQMTVTLTADNPDTDTEILGLASTVGTGSGDLVVVTDGENFYPYRMAVRARRVIGLGETASMTCSTVATSPWRIQVPSSASNYVDTVFYPDVNDGHSATVDITGKRPGKDVTIYVANFKRDAAAVNAQGAYYVLVTDVTGAPTRSVYMSRGTEVTWGESYLDYASGTTFAVTPAETNAMTAAIASNVNETVFTTLGVPVAATNYVKALFTVKDNAGEDVVKYDVMAYSWMSMAVGQEAPGCLNGAKTPWVVVSSDPEHFVAEPTVYNALNSARVQPLAPGDFSLWATNAQDQLSWYVIRAKAYDETSRTISLATGASTNITITCAEGLASLWSATSLCEHVTATLDNTTLETNRVTLTIAAGTTEGSHQVKVTGDYHHEEIEVFVGADPGQEVIHVEGTITFSAPNTISLPLDCVGADWTASVTETAAGKFEVVSASGTAGTAVRVKGTNPGTGQVIVKTATTIYVYDVEVAKNDGLLQPITVGVGYTVTTNLTALSADLAGATLAQSPDSMIATAYVQGGALLITGVQDGRTTVKLATDTYLYTLEIIVHTRQIRKDITLYVGEDGTATSYSYTFDRVVSVNNVNPERVTATQNGSTVTLTPVAQGIAQVNVEGYVDGYDETTTVIYGITIKQEQSGYRVKDFDEGYIAYRDVDVMREVDGDLVFVFTNVNASGSFRVPDGYSARMDFLAVGGGGGGGSATQGFGFSGGGGGAGGFSSVTNKKMVAGTFGVMVGAGGLGLSAEISGGASLPGSNGGASVLTNAFGYTFVYANGGGGGGAPSPDSYSGLDGGSGGGGSWTTTNANGTVTYVPGRGGLGVDGQGCAGGTPTEQNCGGGGGGASGNGGEGQTRGPGKYSDISGENVYYALGGFGGRADTATPAADGQGPGFGGDGGNGGAGGDGGSGAFVVRIKRLYQNVLVPIPTTNDLITARFKWEDGTNCVPFQYAGRSFVSSSDKHTYDWEDAIKEVTGTTNVVCELGGDGGTNKVGIGYYNFRITLNDGFAWDDGTSYGDTEKMSYRWAIVDQWEDIDADIAINKTVWWSDKSNATIRVNSIASPETSGGGTPNVLYLGTLCGAHGLSSSVINAALNAVTAVGNVDCYLFNSTTEIGINSGADIHHEDGPYFTTNMVKGMTINYTFQGKSGYSGQVYDLGNSNATGNHDSMLGFYRQIYANMTNANPKTYDYIIFSFDRTRLAERFDLAFEHEADVAEYLKPFYAEGKVIWLVDNDPVTLTVGSTSVTTFPWFPANLTYYNDGESLDKGVEYWKSSSPCSTWASSGEYAYVPYNALVGLMCPSNYPVDKATYTANVMPGANDLTYAKVMATACAGIESQCAYDDADEVAAFVADRVKVKPFNLYYKDKIVSPAEGLTIQSVTITVCTKGEGDTASTNDTDWVALMHWNASTDTYVYDDVTHASGVPGASMHVDTVSNLVTACLSNIDFKVWVRYDTHVLDADGTFQTSEGAEYNEATGQYEKNPNEGTAYITMINELGVGIGVEGDADTEVPWRYTAYQITGNAQNGYIYVAGTQYSTLSCAEGRDVTVYYRGNGGYRLTAIRVDGNSVEVSDDYANSYVFENLQANHSITVVYSAYYGTVTPVDETVQYDGHAHVPEVELEGWDATYATETRYAISADGPYYTAEEFDEMYSTNREVTCVGDHTVYCRVYAYQPGYGATLNEAGWVWVDTRVEEIGTITITRKPLVITANSFSLSSDQAPKDPPLTIWEGVTVEGLVAGDTVNTNSEYLVGSCPDYQYAIAQYRIDPVLADGKVADDIAGGNYTLYLRPGVVSVIKSPMVVGGITQFDGLDADDPYVNTGVARAEKVYDGVATNLVITVEDPTGAKAENLVYKYSTDDGKTWTTEMPTRLHVGTNKVWYVIEDGTDEEKAMYFTVSNFNYVVIDPRPITFTAASATKRYDTQPLTTNDYAITEGSLAPGDSLYRISVNGSQTDVGTSANTVSGVRIRCDAASEERTGDYAITCADGALTVTPGSIVIDTVVYEPGGYVPYGSTGVDDAVKVYDGLPTNIVVDVTTPGSGATVLYSTTPNDPSSWTNLLAFTDAGTNVVYFMVEAPNYATVTNFARVIIDPRPITVSVNPAFMRSGENEPEYSVIVTDDLTGEMLDPVALGLAYTIGSTNGLTVGTHDLVATGEAVQGNYSITYVPSTLTVTDKLMIDYEVSGTNVVYDGEGHGITVTVTDANVPSPTIRYALSQDGPWYDELPAVTNVVQGGNGGTLIWYAITTDEGGYQSVTNNALVRITPAPVTVTANDASKDFGAADPAFTATVSGLIPSEADRTDLITYTLTRDTGEEVGTYAIHPHALSVQGNYAVTCVDGTFEIKQWTYPAGPDEEPVIIPTDWIVEKSGDPNAATNYAAASNYTFSVGENGYTNWFNYVMGLDPTNLESVIYLDIVPNYLCATNPTFVTRGMNPQDMPVGNVTNISYRLMQSEDPAGPWTEVNMETFDGIFPQKGVPFMNYRVRCVIHFKEAQ